ncbi:MAG: DUF4399 domain-containing protein [Pseudomonadota bacterium]
MRPALALLLVAGLVAAGCDRAGHPSADRTQPDGEAGPKVYFVNIEDGQRLTSPFKIVFGLKDHGIAPAGVDLPATGHHHLLIDTQMSEEAMRFAIPKDDQHRHFGGGQTETVLDLPPGRHRLQLLLGDANHRPHDPPIISAPLTVIVE